MKNSRLLLRFVEKVTITISHHKQKLVKSSYTYVHNA